MSICEYCHQEHDGSYGSGRFCNSKCARGFSTRNKRSEINKKVSIKLCGDEAKELREQSCKEYLTSLEDYTLDPQQGTRCSKCGKVFDSYSSLRQHVRVHGKEYTDEHQAMKVRAFTPRKGMIELDITQQELQEYRESQLTCEICGRQFSHYQTVKGEKRQMSLCVDHDHKTDKFRGLLCVLCNRSLEWTLRYQQQIDAYLSKNNGD